MKYLMTHSMPYAIALPRFTHCIYLYMYIYIYNIFVSILHSAPFFPKESVVSGQAPHHWLGHDQADAETQLPSSPWSTTTSPCSRHSI